ncbi:nucleoside diphosphate kinase regulator [Candidatus Saccharibacteria bacterium]|nr:nucleoside diphosphate kinase regulator [Candidatus Saccharibacteria bacterium]
MNKIYITQYDIDRLNKLLSKRKPHDEYDKALIEELARAEIIDPQTTPSDIVTMNSIVKFKDKNGDSHEYSLVFPEDADLTKNKISVLSPVGSSLIGYKIGSSINIPTPKGPKLLTVEEIIYQPERSGDFDL